MSRQEIHQIEDQADLPGYRYAAGLVVPQKSPLVVLCVGFGGTPPILEKHAVLSRHNPEIFPHSYGRHPDVVRLFKNVQELGFACNINDIFGGYDSTKSGTGAHFGNEKF
ncbi:hypothetical protein WA026_023544 [Henosepilachna vigintioctopunctata]|uniref:Uncharacterized protein n=1 Tax=Henosepilachna vigintioctopunctata TaxID=420089 RepID=A0AAW1USC4_9CUCU